MLKSLSAVIGAATIAAILTFAFTPAAPVVAGPMAKPVEAAISVCAERPWPYMRCVGTSFGNPHVRLISTDRFAAN